MRKVFAIVVMLVIVLSVIVFVWAKAQNGFSARQEPSALEKVVARSVRWISVPSSVRDLKSPTRIDDESLVAARSHWADHCALCHASDGSGETLIGKGLFPKPPDMRTPTTQSKSDGELFFTIENGIRLTGMPAFGSDGDHGEESWALVGFIRQLPQLTPEEVRAIEAMSPRSPGALPEKDSLREDAPDAGIATRPEKAHDHRH